MIQEFADWLVYGVFGLDSCMQMRQALSLPEATLLKKVMTWRLIGIFFGVVALFIILSGYLFNIIL